MVVSLRLSTYLIKPRSYKDNVPHSLTAHSCLVTLTIRCRFNSINITKVSPSSPKINYLFTTTQKIMIKVEDRVISGVILTGLFMFTRGVKQEGEFGDRG